MRKYINITFILFSLHVLLSGCPYKEVYESTVENIFESGINIYPETVFYIEKKDAFSATFGFKINNTTKDTFRFRFDSTFLASQNKKVSINSVIYVFGNLLNANTELVMRPMADTTIGLNFKGKFTFTKEEIILHLKADKINVQIPYKRISKR